MYYCIKKPAVGNQDPFGFISVLSWQDSIWIFLTIKYLQLIKLLFTLKHFYKDGDVISCINLYSPRTSLRVRICAWVAWTEDHS